MSPVAVNDEPDGEDIVHPVKIHFLLLHFLPDGPGGLGADLQFVPDTRIGELFLERLNELGGQFDAVFLRSFQAIGDGPVLLRLGKAEVDVLHFAFDVVQAQLVGEGNVQHERLQNLVFAGRFGEHVQVSHDLQAVGDFQHRHTGIGGILDNQFLIILGLQAGVFRFDRGDLVQTVHHGIDVVAERFLPDIGIGMHALGFMQENRGDAFGREGNLVRCDQGDAHRVADKGGSVAAFVFGKGPGGYLIGLPNHFLPRRVIVWEFLFYDIHGIMIQTRLSNTLAGPTFRRGIWPRPKNPGWMPISPSFVCLPQSSFQFGCGSWTG